MLTRSLYAAALAALLSTAPALAAEHEVKALNKGAEGAMVFEPALVKAAPGDTIKFVMVDKGHNVQSIDGLLPAGVQPFVAKTNESYTLSVTAPGLYAVECKPHFPMGMVALVVVGDGKANIDAVKAAKLPGKAKQRMDMLVQQAGL